MTISEAALWIKLNGKIEGTKKTPSDYRFENQKGNLPAGFRALGAEIPSQLTQNSSYKEYQASLMIEGFVAGQGWGEYRPNCAVQLNAGTNAGDDDKPVNVGTGYQVGPKISMAGLPMVFKDAAGMVGETFTEVTDMPKNWIGGGAVGPRVWKSLIEFKPWAVGAETAGPPGSGGPPGTGQSSPGSTSGGGSFISFDGSTTDSKPGWRIVLYDRTGPGVTPLDGAVDTGNLIQCLPIGFPNLPTPPPKRLAGQRKLPW